MINSFTILSRKSLIVFLLAALLFSAPGFVITASARALQAAGDAAELVDRSPDQSVARGQSFSIFIALTNTGTTTWEPGVYSLKNQQEPMGADVTQPLSSSVTSGGTSIWTINMVAPTISGVYHTIWMVDDNGTTFGPVVDITVTVLAPNVRVSVGGVIQGKYLVKPNKFRQQTYVGLNNGPVRVQGLNTTRILVGERDTYMDGLVAEGYSQILGLPAGKLSTRYYFPSYDNVNVNEQLIFVNVGTADTRVRVTIGGAVMGTYTLVPKEVRRVRYTGVNSGPVVVNSLDGVNIIAEERDLLMDGLVGTSWSQLMGLPSSELSTVYYFPVYNNVSVNEQLMVSNVGATQTVVTVTIAGTPMGSFTLQPNELKRVSYAGLNNGPLVVSSSGGVNIIAALLDVLMDGSVQESYAQLMGTAANAAGTRYYFPAYDNVNVGEQLIFANVGTGDTKVTVTIGGVQMGSYVIHAHQMKRVSFAGINKGPVVVQGSNTQKIVVVERDILMDGLAKTSWAQVNGMPASLPYTQYYFPAYNNINLRESIVLSRP